MMKENLEPNDYCARAEELVTYLYGEASEHEAAEFKRHIKQCGSCSNELAAFGRVREDVIEWRNQSLPSFDAAHSNSFSSATASGRKRSALAAIREFFALAPVWMRAATAIAAILICASVVFTVMHLSEQPKTVVKVAETSPTQAQVDEMMKQRAVEHRQNEKQEALTTATEKPSIAVAVNDGTAQRTMERKSARGTSVTSVSKREQLREKPDTGRASQEARQQLAELVQTSKEDDGLPRLSDLIDDANDAH